MKRYEYQTKVIDAKGWNGGKVNIEDLDKVLNELGSQGWRLVEKTASNEGMGNTRYILCVFERELE
ncbi:DUF4177 domain-containing protein [Candidatus Bathycorpusculum sp.]|jgi:hypothetical protein|uniref:DUF4177 domain-containing protein n=1 Tax=Candidatus Bathycorpusculum sp. TaxID=2994959 RepID=UPI00282EE9A6|nr:DUF4177 domain-containing protein [Candidatus Termitimicrobium sp.]MCL2684888.1 DUF4177 domain-containing protein [Candidatus Termitimicrobium sp.]MDR2719266.1 DUF4177 domain-containing protein [Nitrososphaerota archaeon]